jgi:hypothetical protein
LDIFLFSFHPTLPISHPSRVSGELPRDNEYLIAERSRLEPFCLHINFEVHHSGPFLRRHVNKAADGKQICEARKLVSGFCVAFFAGDACMYDLNVWTMAKIARI